ncbi:MAG: kelch repeat-containing protein [Phycisphaerales bacterium JB043]
MRLLGRFVCVSLVCLLGPGSSDGQDRDASPEGLNQAGGVYLESERAFLTFGGYRSDGSGPTDRAWIFHDGAWTELHGSTAPPPRGSHSMVSLGDRAMVFGGYHSGQRLDDAWLFDGQEWSELKAQGPEGCSSHAMAYDPARGHVVLFGGKTTSGLAGDTWVYTDSGWNRLDIDGPAPRWHHAMAYDPVRRGVLLFGGRTDDGFTSETWLFDGARWIELDLAETPTPRDHHAMTTDTAHDRVLVFGGWDGNDELGDLWEWDGRSWNRIDIDGDGGPGARGGHPVLYFDAHTRRPMLYGGARDGEFFSDLWMLGEHAWELVHP